mmetsp:Transcript_3240/g.4726  ORF Transcript_3240/g.4726 Transcript_3240/m.4726 type:complete len:340 (-) Transcript_3240:278-1297(-)
MSSNNIVKQVNDLKQSLVKHQEKDDDEQILDILSHLDKVSVDVSVLAETLIGQVVSKLKTNPNTTIAAKAKTLVKKWKQLAKQSGIGSGKKKQSPTRSSSLSSVTSTSSSTSTAASSTSKTGASASASATSKASTTSSSTSASITTWDHLPPARKSSATKLHQTFNQSKKSLLEKDLLKTDNGDGNVDEILISKATEVEKAIQTFSKGSKKAYIDKIRSLIFNLKKNEPLRDDIILGHKSPEQLVSMSAKELQTVEKAKERSEQVASLQGSRRLDWEQANADKVNEMCGIKGDLLKASLFTCGRCKSHKTTSTQKQTRSADEPMTVFVFCENCGNRWKC